MLSQARIGNHLICQKSMTSMEIVIAWTESALLPRRQLMRILEKT